MNSKLNPELVDNVNPEWTARDFAKAKPASSVLGQIFSPAVAREMLKPRGRPRVAEPRGRINMRVDPNVLNALRSSGRGWQTRVHAVLSEAVAAGKFRDGKTATAA
jgi:uncharacterized protein (DUF4415 family)